MSITGNKPDMIVVDELETAKDDPVAVAITLGNGAEIAVTRDDRLVIVDYTGYRVDLGKATSKRFETLLGYIGRISCHAVKE